MARQTFEVAKNVSAGQDFTITQFFHDTLPGVKVQVTVGRFGRDPQFIFSESNPATDSELALMALLIAPAGWHEATEADYQVCRSQLAGRNRRPTATPAELCGVACREEEQPDPANATDHDGD